MDPPTQPNLFTALNIGKSLSSVQGDVRDDKHLASVFKDFHPEFVFHLAAQPLVKLSYKEPKLTYETNVLGTVNVLEAVRQTESVRSCVVVTSDKCYENREWVYGYRETDPVGGYDPYSSSKGCAELVTACYRKSFFNPESCKDHPEVALSSARAGNVIGGGDWATDRIVPDCIKALSANEDIHVRSPLSTRPWQYVLEPVGGYLLLGALMRKYGSKYSGAWNFGPSDENVVTVEQLVQLIIKNWGNGNYVKGTSSSCLHEATLLKLDISKAQMQLGWKPVYGIAETVSRTVIWYKQFYAGASKNDLLALSIREIRDYTALMDESHAAFGESRK
ncbi:MAG: CDP-glucose 4,6-dehydratase [Candidatus Bathyarchaeia archaeon]